MLTALRGADLHFGYQQFATGLLSSWQDAVGGVREYTRKITFKLEPIIDTSQDNIMRIGRILVRAVR